MSIPKESPHIIALVNSRSQSLSVNIRLASARVASWFSALRARALAARVSSAHSHALAAAEMSVKIHRGGDIYASNVWAHHAEICRHNARKLRGAACTP